MKIKTTIGNNRKSYLKKRNKRWNRKIGIEDQ